VAKLQLKKIALQTSVFLSNASIPDALIAMLMRVVRSPARPCWSMENARKGIRQSVCSGCKLLEGEQPPECGNDFGFGDNPPFGPGR